MFDIRHIDLADGAYTGSRINGAECAIMTHMETLDKIVYDFVNYYDPCEDEPEELLNSIIDGYNIEITQADADYISMQINLEMLF